MKLLKSPEHTHTYTIKGERIKADNPKYAGTTMDKAFLLRVCDCGRTEAFEYGAYSLITELYKKLTQGV